jgi:hypothetical protein
MPSPPWTSRILVPVLASVLVAGGLDAVLSGLDAPTSIGIAHAKDGGSGDGGGERGESSGHGEGHDSGGKGRGRSGDGDGQRGADDDGGDREHGRRDRDDRDRRSLERYAERLKRNKDVAWTRRDGDAVSVRYADGWTETVAGNRYRLTDGANRLVVERDARDSDRRRLSVAERSGR